MRVEDLLVESGVTKIQCAALFDPGRGELRGSNVDLVFAAGGDRSAQLAHHVLLGEDVDQAVVILDGNEVTARGINTLLEDIGHLAEVGAESRQHRGLVSFTGTASSRDSGIGRSERPVGQRSGGRTIELSIDRLQGLQAGDLLSEVDDLGLHAVVGGPVLSGQGTVLGAVGVQEGLSLVEQVGATLAQIIDI